MSGRLQCERCGHVFLSASATLMVKRGDTCDDCGGPLQRLEDRSERITPRQGPAPAQVIRR